MRAFCSATTRSPYLASLLLKVSEHFVSSGKIYRGRACHTVSEKLRCLTTQQQAGWDKANPIQTTTGSVYTHLIAPYATLIDSPARNCSDTEPTASSEYLYRNHIMFEGKKLQGAAHSFPNLLYSMRLIGAIYTQRGQYESRARVRGHPISR